MSDKRHLLKIKLRSLALEAMVIRRAERALAMPAMKLHKADTPTEAAHIKAAIRIARAEMAAQPWFAENRAKLEELHIHRTLHLREHIRATHLAYGFIRGRTLRQLEGNRPVRGDGLLNEDDRRVYTNAQQMAVKYGAAGISKSDMQRDFGEWTKLRDVKLIVEGSVQRLEQKAAAVTASQSASLPF